MVQHRAVVPRPTSQGLLRGAHQYFAGGILQYHAIGAQAHRLGNRLGLDSGCYQDDPRRPSFGPRLTQQIDARGARHVDVEHRELRLVA